nr:EOG090X0CJA [Eulimnadia texana]
MNQEEAPQQQAPGMARLMAHVSARRVDTALWCTRLATLIFSIGYLLPLFGSPTSAYYKALMANAATSALRLHQRLPGVQFNLQFLGQVFMEDSAHYLLYSLVFLYSAPITLALIPIFLFALLHICSYTLTLLDLFGPNFLSLVRMAVGVAEVQSVNILRSIAFSEIFLFPVIILMIFFGRASLLTAFTYYRFLTLRYASRRNPYTRNCFAELRLTAETLSNHHNCPPAIRNLVHKSVALVSRLAPPVARPLRTQPISEFFPIFF